MTISMHAASAPIFERMLDNLLGWLQKAEAHAETKRFDSANYLVMRLAPDMLPFASQVRIACDIAKTAVAQLAGVEAPKFADGEATLEALGERVRKTLAFVRSISPAQIDGSAANEIVLPQRSGDPLRFTGESFLQRWALPNFFFHATTTYALLRHAGVDVGKADYLG
jgi:hypothetical protein